MYKFGKGSQTKLESCHPDLQKLLNAVMAEQVMDFTVLCGQRSEEEQTKAFNKGSSTVNWPDSRHNKIPSLAFDIAPYPIDWNDIQRFKDLSFVVMKCAQKLKLNITYGGYWTKPKDYPHYQLELSQESSNNSSKRVLELESELTDLDKKYIEQVNTNKKLQDEKSFIDDLIGGIKSLFD